MRRIAMIQRRLGRLIRSWICNRNVKSLTLAAFVFPGGTLNVYPFEGLCITLALDTTLCTSPTKRLLLIAFDPKRLAGYAT